MQKKIFVYNPTVSDKLSAVRGIGRYLQILKENFADEFVFSSKLPTTNYQLLTTFVNPFFNFLQPPLTLKRIANKQIAVIHDLIPLKYPSHFPAGVRGNINIFLNKLALKNYDLIITDSEASKADIINILGIYENKIRVIYPCLPKIFTESQNSKVTLSFPRRRESRLKLPYKDVIIDWIPSYEGMTSSSFCLYVGDATWNKNLVNIARTIKIANVTCVFVGKIFQNVGNDPRVVPNKGGHGGPPLQNINHPWLAELNKFYELTKDDKRFIFAGFIPDYKLFKLYEQASVNLLLSSAEGFGFSYLEAANFSCPSLLSDIPVLREISNSQALFADPKNPHDIADKINEIYFDKTLRNKIGTDAKKRSEFFSAKKFKKEFLAVI